jgi:hypothetical protein
VKTTNPLKHAYPHAKLQNVTLTSINRLTKTTAWLSRHMIENNDLRNWSLSGIVGGLPDEIVIDSPAPIRFNVDLSPCA